MSTNPLHSRSSVRRRLIGVFVMGVAALAGGLITWQVSRTVHGTSGNPLGELLVSFGPSALFASGRGMTLVVGELPAELDAFLQGETASFNPDTLPDTLSGTHVFGEYRETFTLTHWLLFYSVGWTWRLFGIHTAALHLLAGAMGGFMAASLYLLFRLGMNRLFALAGALFTLLLPPFLLVMPSLRDFSKGPFTLLFLALTGMLLSTRSTAKRFIVLSIVSVFVLGLGFGFRQDLLVCLPVAVLACMAAPLHGGYRPVLRLSAAVCVLVVFLLLAVPVLRGMGHESGSVTSHTLVQGLSREAEQTMGFGDAAYDLLLTPSDPEVHAVVNAHARMRGDDSPMPLYLSAAYGRAGRRLFVDWARTFPADMFARGLAAIGANLRPVSLTLSSDRYQPVREALGAWPQTRWHTFYAEYIEPFSPLLVVAALFIVGIAGRKRLFWALLILAYFMAYPSLLFQIRHAFHLAFVVPWAGFFLLERGARLSFGAWRTREDMPVTDDITNTSQPGRPWRQTVLLLLVLSMTTAALLLSLRFVQGRNAHRLLEQYQAQPLTSVETTTVEQEGQFSVVRPVRPLPGLEEAWSLPVGDTATSYLALSFSPPEYAFPVEIRYAPGQGPHMTRRFIVPAGDEEDGPLLMYVPIYALADFTPPLFQHVKNRFGGTPLASLLVHRLGINTFQGIALRKDTLPFLENMYYVENHAELPWLLFLRGHKNSVAGPVSKRLFLEKNALRLPVELRFWLIGDVDAAAEAYLRLLARHPGHRPYARRLETLAGKLEDMETRVGVLMNLSGYREDRVQHYAEEIAAAARTLSDLGDFSRAERYFATAITLAPRDFWHQVHLAEMHAKRGDTDTAVRLFTRVLAAAPDSPHSAEQVDRLLVQTRTPQERTVYWRALCEQHDEASVPWHYLGRALEAEDRNDEARAAYRHALENDPGYEETLLQP